MKKLLLFPAYLVIGWLATRLAARYEEALADIEVDEDE